MRRITEKDLNDIIGMVNVGYTIVRARVMTDKEFSDSDHYGIALCKNEKGSWVTWQFHYLEDESVSIYWGHYYDDEETALADYETRG